MMNANARAWTRKYITAALLILGSMIFSGCRKEAPPPEDTFRPPPNLRKYIGTYRIDPSYDATTIVLRENGSVSYSSREVTNLAGTFTIDERILRVFLTLPGSRERRPLGVFLLSRFDASGWPGLWDGETRNLLRVRGK